MPDDNGLDKYILEVRKVDRNLDVEQSHMTGDKVKNSFASKNTGFADRIWQLFPEKLKLVILLGACGLTTTALLGFSGKDALTLFSKEQPKTPSVMMGGIDKKLGLIIDRLDTTDKKLNEVIRKQGVADEKMDNMKDDISENRNDIKDLLKK